MFDKKNSEEPLAGVLPEPAPDPDENPFFDVSTGLFQVPFPGEDDGDYPDFILDLIDPLRGPTFMEEILSSIYIGFKHRKNFPPQKELKKFLKKTLKKDYSYPLFLDVIGALKGKGYFKKKRSK
jgi:hypothetical protein